MRLVSTLLFLALTGTVAVADDAKPVDPQPDPQPTAPAAPVKTRSGLRVVRVMAETHQALLFDKNKGTHVLAEVGKPIDGYMVDDIDDDAVTLSGENGAELVLTAPDPSWRHRRDDAPIAKPATKPEAAAATKTGEAAPVDPYAVTGPVDPYAEPVRVVDAPHVIEAGEGGVRTAEAPDASAPAPVATPAPAPVTAPATPAPVVTAALAVPPDPDAPTILPRADVSAALSNFGRLASSVRGSFTPAGVKLDTILVGSLFAKAGLHAGDLITAVDNQPLHSIDDAAELYARAASARNGTLAVTRAGKPITLHILIQ